MLRPHDLDQSLAPAAPLDARARTLWGMRLGAAVNAGDVTGALAHPADPTSWVDCALPLLQPGAGVDGPGAAPVDDLWLAGGDAEALHSGHTGAVRWWQRGAWLAAAVDWPEVDDGAGLQALSGAAYDALFGVLQARGTPHVLRFWNYVARINEPAVGLERYRHFNLGRQQAFERARRSAFEGSPAASAVGSPAGAPLQVRVIASTDRRSTAVENPRQVSAYRYPSAYGPAAPTFSRAALLTRRDGSPLLVISGTASILGHETVHLGDVHAQTHEACRNLQAVLAAARKLPGGQALETLANAALTIYVRHPADQPRVAQALAEQLGADAPALAHAAWLQADICRADLLVEIEAVVQGPPLVK
ncbi:hypothetical protein FVQ98_00465 [Ottowia sp. GY511]|uniref:Chorismatase FkbO/Hyg5-like N-terminal domain-containing protein n=1 Tax=Ottowia flava TaxID=2675430 RepID=A0ABW4KSL5_9BURK|nr:hypothetical protein [Ottowia sp. GY511]TXK33392.1 hypothetical protein FVQ98_00465 [Ottowia sp. GY511]